MRFAVVCIFLLAVTTTFANVEKVRNEFPYINSLEKIEIYIKQLENDKSANAQAYLAALYFLKSKHVKFPISKWNYFKKGKTLLNKVVEKWPNNIEYRYLRLVFQHKLPDFLDYNSNIKTDFNTYLKNFESSPINKAFKYKMVVNLLKLEQVPNEYLSALNKLKANLV